MPVFVTFSWTIREITMMNQEEFSKAGMLWFSDLTEKASYGYLKV
jgi:hypothetical protein